MEELASLQDISLIKLTQKIILQLKVSSFELGIGAMCLWMLKSLGCLSRARTWTRFLLVGVTLLCLTSTWSNILAFNFVMVCTQGEAPALNETEFNGTTIAPVKVIGASQPAHFSVQQRLVNP